MPTGDRVPDRFPRKFVTTRGLDQAFMIQSWPGIALYIGVSVPTATRMSQRIDDPLPVQRSDAVRGVWIPETELRAWMGRHGMEREPI